jgi:hypothetical protein
MRKPKSGREWFRTANRITGAATAGTTLGWALSRLDLWAIANSARECEGTSGVICIGSGPIIGFVAGAVLTLVVCGPGFMLIGLRPLRISAPSGIILTGLTITAYLGAVPGGHLSPTWVFTITMTIGFGLLAMAMAPTRALRIAGITILTTLLIAAWLGARPLHDRIQNETPARASPIADSALR